MRGGLLCTMIVPGRGILLPSSRVPGGGMVLDEIDTRINQEHLVLYIALLIAATNFVTFSVSLDVLI